MDDVSSGALHRRWLPWLSAQERRRYEAMRTEHARREFLAARALCRATLSRYAAVRPADWVFDAGRHGKPTIASPANCTSLRFSLSHAGGLIVCAVSRAGEVGVDVEDTSRPIDIAQVARHFMNRREQSQLAELAPSRRATRFFAQWVAREAYLKGVGRGIASAPERFTVAFESSGHPEPIGRWRLFLRKPTPRHVAVLALRPRRALAPVSVRWRVADLSL